METTAWVRQWADEAVAPARPIGLSDQDDSTFRLHIVLLTRGYFSSGLTLGKPLNQLSFSPTAPRLIAAAVSVAPIVFLFLDAQSEIRRRAVPCTPASAKPRRKGAVWLAERQFKKLQDENLIYCRISLHKSPFRTFHRFAGCICADRRSYQNVHVKHFVDWTFKSDKNDW